VVSLQLSCPAKINLTLEVTGHRPDGSHTVRSLMVPLELADELEIEPSDRFGFECDDTSLAGEENLVVRAARALAPEAQVLLRLRKRIPHQAGLGGGSSDAAGLLLAAMQGGFPVTHPVDWLALARSLGSDVPFFLTGSGALVEGTGERVTAVGALPPWYVLVVKPPASVSTGDAYRMLDEHPRPSRPRNVSVTLRAVTALQRGDFSEVEQCLLNDFHDVVAAEVPEVARVLDALTKAGATNALLAGSGSSVFTLAQYEGTIEALLERLELPQDYLRFPTRFAIAGRWRPSAA
jgi:4-diphosphocytidyl-2-C-methyl-D-erythritol kinase